MSAGFVHLHVHTDYSVLDGATKIGEMLQRCADFGMHACAITDHGSLFGAVDFYTAAQKAGIKPIIGSELYLARGSRFDKRARSQSESYFHLLLLCENEEGYHNLCQLSTLGYLEGHHYRPRVDEELLTRYNRGLIAMSACLGGEIPHYIQRDEMDKAKAAIEKYIRIYGRENFYIELMDHGMPEERRVNPILVELARKYGLQIVATNDSHYLDKQDAEAHQVLLCIQTQTVLSDENHFKFPTNEFHFCSPDEMREKFAEWPEAVANTEAVAARCNLTIPLGQQLVPKYRPPEGLSKEVYLRQLVALGLSDRYHGNPGPEHVERAEYELGVIEKMQFVDYFLVVWDLINFARGKGIPVGPGRGSGAGSLVAYALRITNLDPIRYNLLFERFLNPDRVSMPDFDLDFCYRRREEVIEYVHQKYGADNVSQIITFGRMLARQAIRNVGRVMGMSYTEVDSIAKLIPDELNIKLKDAMQKEPELKRRVAEEPQIARLWHLATRLEGIIGNCGTHAAGVVICDEPLTNHVALFKAPTGDVVATQAEMKCVEKIGLLKMDLLGLRTLTVIADAVKLIRENHGVNLDMDDIPLDDAKTYELLRSGRTTGVFQLESSGMRDLSKRIGLESIEEICALVALYRPGPMQFIDQYVESKHNASKIVYDHPMLEPILKETYGVMLYQEQVMHIVRALAGFSLGQADIMRRAMGKKDAELMARQRKQFVEGAVANGVDEKLADAVFTKIELFAGYAFNKSHSMAYAFVAYQTAYLKANYPVEFMAALLSSEAGDMDKVALYVEECRQMGFDVLPPDINNSGGDFTVEGSRIRFGLGAIKNVGSAFAETVFKERNTKGVFSDIFDFCCRMGTKGVNRRLIESMNKAGAFVSTGWNRRQVEAVIDAALEEGQIAQRERDAGQTSLFDLMEEAGSAPVIHHKPALDEWPEAEILAFEKETLGLYVSSHPLARHKDVLRRFTTVHIADLPQLREGQEVVVGGIITLAKQHITSRGQKMAFITLDTLEGPCEITVFSDTYEQCAGLLAPDMVVMIPARVNFRNNTAGLIASDVIRIEDAEKRLARVAHIRLRTAGLEESLIERLAKLLGDIPGPCEVQLHCIRPDHSEVIVAANGVCRVAATPALRKKVEDLLGENTLWFSA